MPLFDSLRFKSFLLLSIGFIVRLPLNTHSQNEIRIGKSIVTEQTAGSIYLKRAIKYFVINAPDTSDFHCTLSESLKTGVVSLDINFQHSAPALSYRKKMDELKLILPTAAEDFNFDSLGFIHLGRLVAGGDLAIAVGREYFQKFGPKEKPESYPAVADFLKSSKLGKDFNALFQPYGLSVKSVSIEKLFFTTTKSFESNSGIETEPGQIPEKILDCIVWINLEKK